MKTGLMIFMIWVIVGLPAQGDPTPSPTPTNHTRYCSINAPASWRAANCSYTWKDARKQGQRQQRPQPRRR